MTIEIAAAVLADDARRLASPIRRLEFQMRVAPRLESMNDGSGIPAEELSDLDHRPGLVGQRDGAIGLIPGSEDDVRPLRAHDGVHGHAVPGRDIGDDREGFAAPGHAGLVGFGAGGLAAANPSGFA